ncbi:glycosyl hydrolase family 18 protein [Rhodohalobacter sp. 614A]|uniref:glycosyl hydrolase family 18 protein n=1 Tax=Rhodohalobacter sp. 614A TaxID=2908649 RepID=UPI001F45CCAD|nr:glycosyl hydrolase family 18 protein [Rhodohalobacter sp. 614A]
MKKFSKNRLFCAVLILFSLPFLFWSCTGTSTVQNKSGKESNFDESRSKNSFRVVGYYSIRAAIEADPQSVPFDQLTHVNLWFFNPDSLGNYNLDLSGLSDFVDEAHDQNVNVLFSIGGGGHYPHYKHLLTDQYRSRLIDNLVDQVLKYNLDGVDVDLEGSAIDKNYEPFVTELGTKLRSHNKLMTAAIAVYYKDQLTDKALAQYDFMNIMVYDRTGPWRPDQPGPHSTFQNAVDDLDYFKSERNIPKEKIVLGVPFYGYAFSTVPGNPPRSMNYKEITTTYPGSEWVDEWPLPGDYTIYYNGIPTIIRKTVLAKEEASGIMIWQLLGDAENEKSLLSTINRVAYSY